MRYYEVYRIIDTGILARGKDQKRMFKFAKQCAKHFDETLTLKQIYKVKGEIVERHVALIRPDGSYEVIR